MFWTGVSARGLGDRELNEEKERICSTIFLERKWFSRTIISGLHEDPNIVKIRMPAFSVRRIIF